jgi:3-deoxy-D-manno-octulosonic-acid transferase
MWHMILHAMLYRIYSALFLLALPWLFLRLCYKSCKNAAHWAGIGARFGIFTPNLAGHSKCIWLHAVSLGEAKAALPLIYYLLHNYEHQIIVTTMTLTGAQCLRAEFTHEPRVRHLYAPYDANFIVKRFLRYVNPKICLLMETEIWPAIIYVCNKQAIPIIILNARLSKKSAQGYKTYSFFFKDYLDKIAMICAQSQLDLQRFLNLGVLDSRAVNIGNLKFDLNLPSDLVQKATKLRDCLVNKFVVVAASTHSGEEEILLQAFDKLQHLENLVLIIIPRHPERFGVVSNLLDQQKRLYVRKTMMNFEQELSARIILGDTIGELLMYYSLADVCFVGGSLVKIGGHNLLEPAMMQKAIITGKHLDNFIELSQKLFNANGLIIVKNKANLAKQLAAEITSLYYDDARRQELAANAYQTVLENKGALARTSVILTNYL